MKVLLKILILAGVVALSILADDYVARGMSVAVCVLVAIIGYNIDTERRGAYGVFLLSSGYILALIFYLLTHLLQVHVDTYDNHQVVYSRFFVRKLAEGKTETKTLAYAFRTEWGFVNDIECDEFCFVYTDKNTCIICSRYAQLFEVELPFSMVEKEFQDGQTHGCLQFIVDKQGIVYDLHGNVVEDDYVPIRVDHTVPNPYPA